MDGRVPQKALPKDSVESPAEATAPAAEATAPAAKAAAASAEAANEGRKQNGTEAAA